VAGLDRRWTSTSLGYVPAPRTILSGVAKLPPASCAVYDASGLRLWRWWDVDYREKIDVGEAEAIDLAWDCLRESVRLRLESDVPLGLLLSGGVDSSLVAAVLADHAPARRGPSPWALTRKVQRAAPRPGRGHTWAQPDL
jgi:asparagine synthase (glutamine-hydrolysing)